jgi:phosphatidylglycerophosphate synthase
VPDSASTIAVTEPRNNIEPLISPSAVLLRATRDESAGGSLKVAGLTVVERAIRQFGRTPTTSVIVVTDGSMPLPSKLPPNVQVRTLAGAAATDSAIAESTIDAIRTETGARVILAADVVRVKANDLTAGIRVTDETTRTKAEDAIFADLLRGDLGLIARHVNKKISFRITRYLLCHLPFTPNQVTLGAAAIGLLGCLLITAGTYPTMIAGLLLAQFQSILDGCDGELARVRFQQSAIGEWLDTLVDDFMNLAIIASLGVGLWRAGLGWPAPAGAIAACGMYLVYNVVSYRELIRQGQGGELIKIRWKLARGQDMKAMWGNSGGGKPGGGGAALFVLALGRRDTFVFAWLLLAIVHLLPLALLWAVLVALSCFAMAVGQLVVKDEPTPPRA